jgi:hypothetical protein
MKPDIDHIVPDLLQARARKLGLLISADADQEKGLDFGPFLLRCGQTGYLVWAHGLPAEGIADALNCCERELKLPDEEIGEAWRDFGARWARPEPAR